MQSAWLEEGVLEQYISEVHNSIIVTVFQKWKFYFAFLSILRVFSVKFKILYQQIVLVLTGIKQLNVEFNIISFIFLNVENTQPK